MKDSMDPPSRPTAKARLQPQTESQSSDQAPSLSSRQPVLSVNPYKLNRIVAPIRLTQVPKKPAWKLVSDSPLSWRSYGNAALAPSPGQALPSTLKPSTSRYHLRSRGYVDTEMDAKQKEPPRDSFAGSSRLRTNSRKRLFEEVEPEDGARSVRPMRKLSKTTVAPVMKTAANATASGSKTVLPFSSLEASSSGSSRSSPFQRTFTQSDLDWRQSMMSKTREEVKESEKVDLARERQKVLARANFFSSKSWRQEKQGHDQVQAPPISAAPFFTPTSLPTPIFPPEAEEQMAQRVADILRPALEGVRAERDALRIKEHEREERLMKGFAELERCAAERETQRKKEYEEARVCILELEARLKEEREEDKIRDEARDKATADMCRALGILAKRMEDARRDVGDVLRVLGVEAPSITGLSGRRTTEGTSESMLLAAIGRNRRKLARGGQDVEVDGAIEVIDVDLPEASQSHEEATGKNVLDRLTGLEMDIQECLEKLRDPMADFNVKVQALAVQSS